MTKQEKILFFVLMLCTVNAWSQDWTYFVNGLDITTEAQVTTSDSITPLWLNANKYGLSSTEKTNGYVRLTAIRPMEVDEDYNWRIGYGIDIAAASKFQQKVILQQAFAQVGYKKASLTIGAKQQPIEFKADELTSGALVMGANARPIPQARIDVDWFSFPGTKGLWKWKGHGSYGITTDASWQKGHHKESDHYTGNILYHEKALAWKFGNEESENFPLTYELSLKVASQFGGTTYHMVGRGYPEPTDVAHPSNLKAFWDIFSFSGSDETDGSSKNTAGNHVGSWNMRLKWTSENWSAAARFERMFEDQSMMFIQYGIYDHLLGFDLSLPENRILSAITAEHINTRDQSGAILHDQAINIPDKMNGRDNYYNHNLYSGYQHWGQTMGNPLLTSPIYNSDNSLTFCNNRIKGWHFGLMGDPASWLHWRILASFTKNWGTYDDPYDGAYKQNAFLLEATIYPYSWNGWQAKCSFGIDKGKVIGNNIGGQLTVSRTITLLSN